MLKILSIMAVLLFSSFSYSEELTDEKKKVVDEMLEITGALKIGEMMGNAVAKNMIMSLQQQKQEITPEIAAVIQDEIGKLMHDEFVANGFVNKMSYDIYHKYFTTAELKEIVDFYKTPVGSKMASLLPQISQEGMMAGQKHGMSLGPLIQQRMQARFAKEGINIK